MTKSQPEEIDTIFEAEEGVAARNPAQQLQTLGAEISLGNELESSTMEVSQVAALPEKSFYFNDFPRKVYCTLSRISLRLIQTGEGRGIAYLTFTQSCNSRRSDVAKGADWTFSVALYDIQNAFIRNIHLGYWNHRCGKHLVELRADFSWVLGSINPVIHAQRANLNWQYLQRVHNCG